MFKNLIKNRDLQYKLLFALFAIAIFRFGSHIPIPGIDTLKLKALFDSYDGTIINMFNTFSGGSLSRMSILTIGIVPFISASIIMFLGGHFFEPIKKIKKQGNNGILKINRITRYLTILIGLFQSIALTSKIISDGVVLNPTPLFFATSVLTLLAGTMVIIWLSEKITEFGIGNGTSLIIFASIISGFPEALMGTLELKNTGQISNTTFTAILLIVAAALLFVIFVELGEKRIKTINMKSKGQLLHKEESYIPFKVNMAGVMPPVIAATFMMMPATILNFKFIQEIHFFEVIANILRQGSTSSIIIYSILIFAFAFMFNGIQNNPKDIAERLNASGIMLKGYRPGKSTEKALKNSLNRLTVIGSLFLLIICLMPEYLIYKWAVPFYFGGTSLLIIVSVSMEFKKQFTNSLIAEEYKNIDNIIT